MSRKGPKKNKPKAIAKAPKAPALQEQVQRRIAAQTISTSVRHEEYFQGPLPHPDTLARYEQLSPGCANKIIDQFVEQGRHRMLLEKTVVTGDTLRSYLGVAAAFVIAIGGIGLAYYLVSQGKGWEGTAVVFIDLSTLAGVFVYGTNSRRRERTAKARQVSRQ
jgi:uncharacterized membrane protein